MTYDRLSPERIRKAIDRTNKYGRIITREEMDLIVNFIFELAHAETYRREYDIISQDLARFTYREM